MSRVTMNRRAGIETVKGLDQRVKRAIEHLYKVLMELVDSVPSISSRWDELANNAVIIADGTAGDLIDSKVVIDRDNGIVYLGGTPAIWDGIPGSVETKLTFGGQRPGVLELETTDYSPFLVGMNIDDSLSVGNRVYIGGTEVLGPAGSGISETLVVIGNIAVTGTVDGRDIATDGTKLDGIEAGADVTDATNVRAAGAVMEASGNLSNNSVPVSDASGDLENGSITDDGAGAVKVTATNPKVSLYDSPGSDVEYSVHNVGGNLRIGSDTSTDGTAAMVVESGAAANAYFNGDLGVGTGTPQEELHVNGSTDTTVEIESTTLNVVGLKLTNSVQEWKVENSALTLFQVEDVTNSKVPLAVEPNAPSNSLYVDSSGNVGFGTGSPTQKVEVRDDAANVRLRLSTAGDFTPLFEGDSNHDAEDESLVVLRGYWNGTAVGDVIVQSGADTTNKDDGKLVFRTRESGASIATRMTIDETGNVGIGISAPDAALDVAGVIAVTDGVSAPSTVSGKAQIYVDSADGDLKIRFGDGTVKTIVTDT